MPLPLACPGDRCQLCSHPLCRRRLHWRDLDRRLRTSLRLESMQPMRRPARGAQVPVSPLPLLGQFLAGPLTLTGPDHRPLLGVQPRYHAEVAFELLEPLDLQLQPGKLLRLSFQERCEGLILPLQIRHTSEVHLAAE